MKIAVVCFSYELARSRCMELCRVEPANDYVPLGMLQSVCGQKFDRIILHEIVITPSDARAFLGKLENLVYRLPLEPTSTGELP